jgi:phage-related protein
MGVVNAVVGWLTGVWQGFVAWLTGVWQSVVGIATAVWNTVTGAISAAFNAVVGVVTSVWRGISGVFMSAWNTYIAGPLTGIWNSVSKWFTDLGTSAMNSGKNFIKMLVSGITSGAGAIWNAVVGIAQNIWKALGFHSPAEEGPGADADKWMPNLVSMLSSGLVAGVPKIQAAVNLVAKPLATIGHPGNAAGASSPVAAPVASSPTQGAPVFYVTIQAPAMSKREAAQLGDAMIDYMSHKLRGSGNFVTQTSGGKR